MEDGLVKSKIRTSMPLTSRVFISERARAVAMLWRPNVWKARANASPKLSWAVPIIRTDPFGGMLGDASVE